MNIVEIRDRSDADGGEGTLAVLILLERNGHYREGLNFITDPNAGIQVATMRYREGHLIQPHVHPPCSRAIHLPGEVIVVRSGRVMVDFYNSRTEYVDTRILAAGDVMIFRAGGHGFRVVEDAELVEVRQGPYYPEKDKIRFTPQNGE